MTHLYLDGSQLGDGGAESFAGVLGSAQRLSILSNSNTLWHRARPAVTGIQVVLYVSILLALEEITTTLADTIICYNTDHEGIHAPAFSVLQTAEVVYSHF
jgi:hypothetical protein